MLVFSTPLVNCCPSTFSLTYTNWTLDNGERFDRHSISTVLQCSTEGFLQYLRYWKPEFQSLNLAG
jgi:hypothetical protein